VLIAGSMQQQLVRLSGVSAHQTERADWPRIGRATNPVGELDSFLGRARWEAGVEAVEEVGIIQGPCRVGIPPDAGRCRTEQWPRAIFVRRSRGVAAGSVPSDSELGAAPPRTVHALPRAAAR
jgi:hypothetical protein